MRGWEVEEDERYLFEKSIARTIHTLPPAEGGHQSSIWGRGEAGQRGRVVQPKTKPAIAERPYPSALKLAGQVIIRPRQSGGKGERGMQSEVDGRRRSRCGGAGAATPGPR